MSYSVVNKVAGDEVSSTYEGRHLAFAESAITHPSHSDGLVDKGDPVKVGVSIVGVAFKSALATTDLIAIDSEGIWVLTCKAVNNVGNSAIAVGDILAIQSTCQVDKNTTGGEIFGYALTTLAAGGTGLVIVKVHGGQPQTAA